MGNVIVDWIHITEVRDVTDCLDYGTERVEFLDRLLACSGNGIMG